MKRDYKKADEFINEHFKGVTVYKGHPLEAIGYAIRMMRKLEEPSEEMKAEVTADMIIAFNDALDGRKLWVNQIEDGLKAAMMSKSSSSKPSFDFQRVLAWAKANNRKPAHLSFTEGPERDAAYLVEAVQAVPIKLPPRMRT